ncbi:TPA: hypothetical protein DEP34_00780 [Candidatus Uhrbacteria bacterium]|uniref:DUF1648 domain-containing protein n=2 Tax=Candidatus Uhriibacteriota TaxID=1752732 RepID=A0A0G1SIC6_9BACT|nr:MAG: hypothetical protein UX45_C0002G0058 [Candidatus Uhrbacteria bacterium GW2011_GWF2_46_218]KKU41833.1 MAG: hypothetical protein UX57_C0001G0057 [Candidatus Uhrbacteria bacterium GW2011_GWE2_46_68]HBK34117.1 hypothetical protein [Candidatus Uhrbacteria bacterium]HCB18906.1 hypothetical protein [Candidatus Uhrbacteria bacterium]
MNLFKRHFKPRYLWIALVTLVRQSKTFRITTVISFLFLLAMWFLPIWRIVPLAELKPFLPLHYNVYMGIDRFGPWYGAFVIPVLGTFLWIINSIFEALFFQKARVLSSFFAFGTVVTEGVLLVSLIFMILLNV